MSSSCSSSCCCCSADPSMEAKMALDTWIKAVASGSTDSVLKLYAEESVLLPTLEGRVCDTTDKRRAYFDHFTAKLPQGKINAIRSRVMGDIAINSGHYTFTFKDGSSAAARFSFVYKKTPQGWMIVDHHSSLMPSGH